ncbi:MAG: 16S rRNA (cytidine(1402)-2'-O)-methyltransferase [Bdellovibrionales bacterium CG10_big_fil_rev_8_21_14_0_10_45_34]|nr:MAG: 16S rRNA (cytidine(1402)-2'-O)-methyltransferase [Bdellovibrionales bacterium CG10_big_fil_rev_8_21_14_0_10_45_34]
MALFIVAVPIGNLEDISERAKNTLRHCTLIVGEDAKPLRALVARLKLEKKELFFLNEHTKDQELAEISALLDAHDVALVSDEGTPVFCDPGRKLLLECQKKSVRVVPVPGASSLMATLSCCPLEINEFVFAGFLPREHELRKERLSRHIDDGRPIVLMDTPYRLTRLLSELSELGFDRRIFLATNLTHENEHLYLGTVGETLSAVGPTKAEFVLVLEGQIKASDNSKERQKTLNNTAVPPKVTQPSKLRGEHQKARANKQNRRKFRSR